ncbi:MAG: LysM peptidoglycan-binding domain-containing protein, partial [Candidatus Omnitrophica bacterium]|nr:LysM peptidoglycan-binding domain-containing protein [Candidatus Omnitrophota bacterium]
MVFTPVALTLYMIHIPLDPAQAGTFFSNWYYNFLDTAFYSSIVLGVIEVIKIIKENIKAADLEKDELQPIKLFHRKIVNRVILATFLLLSLQELGSKFDFSRKIIEALYWNKLTYDFYDLVAYLLGGAAFAVISNKYLVKGENRSVKVNRRKSSSSVLILQKDLIEKVAKIRISIEDIASLRGFSCLCNRHATWLVDRLRAEGINAVMKVIIFADGEHYFAESEDYFIDTFPEPVESSINSLVTIYKNEKVVVTSKDAPEASFYHQGQIVNEVIYDILNRQLKREITGNDSFSSSSTVKSSGKILVKLNKKLSKLTSENNLPKFVKGAKRKLEKLGMDELVKDLEKAKVTSSPLPILNPLREHLVSKIAAIYRTVWRQKRQGAPQGDKRSNDNNGDTQSSIPRKPDTVTISPEAKRLAKEAAKQGINNDKSSSTLEVNPQNKRYADYLASSGLTRAGPWLWILPFAAAVGLISGFYFTPLAVAAAAVLAPFAGTGFPSLSSFKAVKQEIRLKDYRKYIPVILRDAALAALTLYGLSYIAGLLPAGIIQSVIYNLIIPVFTFLSGAYLIFDFHLIKAKISPAKLSLTATKKLFNIALLFGLDEYLSGEVRISRIKMLDFIRQDWVKTAKLAFYLALVGGLVGLSFGVTGWLFAKGALIALAAPYLYKVTEEFFGREIKQNILKTQKLKEVIYDENHTGIKALTDKYSGELKRTSLFYKLTYYYPKAAAIFLKLNLPVLSGIFTFARSRLAIAFVSGAAGQALIPFVFSGTFAAQSVLSFLGLSCLIPFATSFYLPHTVASLLSIGILVIGLKVISLAKYRDLLQDYHAHKTWGLKRFSLDELEDKLKRGELADKQKALAFFLRGRPTQRKDICGRSSVSFENALRYYVLPDIAALGVVLTSFLSPLFLPLAKRYPFFSVYKAMGFWSSFLYMSTISAEIGAVVDSSYALSQHPVFGVVGEPLHKAVTALEVNALGWGHGMLDFTQNKLGVSLSQQVHALFGGDKDVRDWWMKEKSAEEFHTLVNSKPFKEVYYDQGLRKAAEEKGINFDKLFKTVLQVSLNPDGNISPSLYGHGLGDIDADLLKNFLRGFLTGKSGSKEGESSAGDSVEPKAEKEKSLFLDSSLSAVKRSISLIKGVFVKAAHAAESAKQPGDSENKRISPKDVRGFTAGLIESAKNRGLKNIPEGFADAHLARFLSGRLGYDHYQPKANLKGDDYFVKWHRDLLAGYRGVKKPLVIEVHLNTVDELFVLYRGNTANSESAEKARVINGEIEHFSYSENGFRALDRGVLILEFGSMNKLLKLSLEEFNTKVSAIRTLVSWYVEKHPEHKGAGIVLVPGHGGKNYQSSYYIDEKGYSHTGAKEVPLQKAEALWARVSAERNIPEASARETTDDGRRTLRLRSGQAQDEELKKPVITEESAGKEETKAAVGIGGDAGQNSTPAVEVDRQSLEEKWADKPDPFEVSEWAKRSGHEGAYTVKKGDTLWGIWKNKFADIYSWTEFKQIVKENNPDISNFDRIYPNQKLILERPEVPKAFVQKPEKTKLQETYIVREGDTLIKIACRLWGDSSRWPELRNAYDRTHPDNRLEVDFEGTGREVVYIYPGQKLPVPAADKAVPTKKVPAKAPVGQEPEVEKPGNRSSTAGVPAEAGKIEREDPEPEAVSQKREAKKPAEMTPTTGVDPPAAKNQGITVYGDNAGRKQRVEESERWLELIKKYNVEDKLGIVVFSIEEGQLYKPVRYLDSAKQLIELIYKPQTQIEVFPVPYNEKKSPDLTKMRKEWRQLSNPAKIKEAEKNLQHFYVWVKSKDKEGSFQGVLFFGKEAAEERWELTRAYVQHRSIMHSLSEILDVNNPQEQAKEIKKVFGINVNPSGHPFAAAEVERNEYGMITGVKAFFEDDAFKAGIRKKSLLERPEFYLDAKPEKIWLKYWPFEKADVPLVFSKKIKEELKAEEEVPYRGDKYFKKEKDPFTRGEIIVGRNFHKSRYIEASLMHHIIEREITSLSEYEKYLKRKTLLETFLVIPNIALSITGTETPWGGIATSGTRLLFDLISRPDEILAGVPTKEERAEFFAKYVLLNDMKENYRNLSPKQAKYADQELEERWDNLSGEQRKEYIARAQELLKSHFTSEDAAKMYHYTERRKKEATALYILNTVSLLMDISGTILAEDTKMHWTDKYEDNMRIGYEVPEHKLLADILQQRYISLTGEVNIPQVISLLVQGEGLPYVPIDEFDNETFSLLDKFFSVAGVTLDLKSVANDIFSMFAPDDRAWDIPIKTASGSPRLNFYLFGFPVSLLFEKALVEDISQAIGEDYAFEVKKGWVKSQVIRYQSERDFNMLPKMAVEKWIP